MQELSPKKIKEAQAMLLLLEFTDNGTLVADGNLGEHTTNALMAYQHENDDLEETGEFDDDTLDELANETPDDLSDKSTTIQFQAAMILFGCTDGNTLVADGVEGEHYGAALKELGLKCLREQYCPVPDFNVAAE